MTLTTNTQRYHKSRTGCLTCKIRKVKCDETHPACQRCVTSGRKCDGYVVPEKETDVVGYLVIQHSPEQYQSTDENRALSYFQHVTAPSLLNLDSASFWSSTVLQVCRREQSLKHLIVAVSLADEQRSSSFLCNFAYDKIRLHHYGKALRLLSSQPEPEIWLMLMASLLLCVYEDLQSRGFSALQHIKSGRSMLRTYGQAKLLESARYHSTETSLLAQLIPIFSKLERQTWEFDPETLSPRSGSSFADLCPGNASTVHMLSPTLFPWTIAFESLKHANQWLYALRARCFASQAVANPPATRFHVVPGITYQLNMWLESLHVFLRLTSQTLSEKDHMTISTLRSLQLCLHVLSQTSPFPSEMLFDEHAHVLEHTIRKLPFFEQTEIDLAPALWLGATKCRNPACRRQALDMLRRTNQKLGACAGRGEVLARAVEKIIDIEEKRLGTVLSCADVPKGNRIRVFGLELVDERNQLNVLFKRTPHDESVTFDVATVSLEGVAMREGTDMRLEAVFSFDWMALEI